MTSRRHVYQHIYTLGESGGVSVALLPLEESFPCDVFLAEYLDPDVVEPEVYRALEKHVKDITISPIGIIKIVNPKNSHI